jgi:hypothetical protein
MSNTPANAQAAAAGSPAAAAAGTPPANTHTAPFVVIYGKSGFGKTSDVGAAYPGALYIASEGAVSSIQSWYGVSVARTQVPTLMELNKNFPNWIKTGKYTALVIDEFDFLAEETMAALEKRVTGFKLFGALRNEVALTARIARDASLPVILTSLEKPPKIKEDGTKTLGGPSLTGDLPEKLPGMADIVLRAIKDPLRKPWPVIYTPDGGMDYVGKDRYSIVPTPSPMNLGEILRLRFNVPRIHPWQEERVVELHTALIQGDPKDDVAVITAYYPYLLSLGIPAQAARWTVRDGWDRTLLARAKRAKEASYF